MYNFDKARRLLKKDDYNSVFRQAEKIVTPCFIVLFHGNSNYIARLGLALSKKIISKAHDRNRIKRVLREAFRIQTLPAIDIVFLARPGISNVKNKTLFTELTSVWNRLCRN